MTSVVFIVNGDPQSAMGYRARAFEGHLRQRYNIKLAYREGNKLAALLRLALALLHASGFRLSGERLPDGPSKRRIVRAVDRARGCSRCGEVRGHDD